MLDATQPRYEVSMKTRWLAASAALAACMPALSRAQELDAATLQRWLDGYGAAWEERDPDAAARLFTMNASYRETPYAEPFRGRNGIRDYWASVTAGQREVDFDAEILAIDGNVGVAHWSATFTDAAGAAPVELDGVFVLEFDSQGLCSELREWWLLRPDGA
jgi:nuclear transport factor 2 (NTF2) superfamily protein